MEKKLFSVFTLIIVISLLLSAGCSRKRIMTDTKRTQVTVSNSASGTESDIPDENGETDESRESESNSQDANSPGNPSVNSDGTRNVNTKNSSGANETVKTPSDTADKGKPSDSNSAIGMIIDDYTKLISEGLGSYYDCDYVKIYLETSTDYLTVNSKSYMYKLIIEAGGLLVSESLGDNLLMIDDEWIKGDGNPQLIVKFVNPSVLGYNVTSTNAAVTACSRLMARSGWDETNAVLHRRVILLSDELLKTEHGKFIVKLYLARAMHPELFSGFDVESVSREVLGSDGICYYGLPNGM